MSALAIPFGLIDGRLVPATAVPRGVACGCVCPGCGAPLVARQGQLRRAHFAHHPDYDACASGRETAVHRMAKQLLAEEKRVLLPELGVSDHGYDARGTLHQVHNKVTDSRVADAVSVEVERTYGEIRPDAIVHESDGTEILVEFVVTHRVDHKKKHLVRDLGLNVVEINLWDFCRSTDLDLDALRELALEATHNRRWVSLCGYADAKKRNREALEEKIAESDRRFHAHRASQVHRFKHYAEPVQARPMQSAPEPVRRVESVQRDIRWLVCESCRLTFEVSKQTADASRAGVECPDCGFPVSTRSSDRRRR